MKDLSKSNLFLYGFLALPIAFAGFPLYILAPDYYAINYNISLTSLAWVLLILRLFDGIQDPFLGFIGDKFTKHTISQVITSSILLSIAFYAVFNPIISPLLWFGISMFIAMTFFSFLSIILTSKGALWSADSEHQNQISLFRETFALIRLLIAVSIPSLLSNIMPNKDAYIWLCIILSISMILGALFFYIWHKRAFKITTNNNFDIKNFFSCLKEVKKKFLVIYAISTLSSSIPAILVIFYVRDILDAENFLGLFLLIYFMSGALFMGMWKKIAEKHGKYQSWFLSMILGIFAFIGVFFLEQGDIILYSFICLTSGIVSGANLMIPPSILGDYIHKNNHVKNASSHYSFMTLIAKGSLGIASITALPAIDYFGFVPNTINSQDALLSLYIIYGIIPCILKAISDIILWWFFIKSKTRYKT